MEAVKLKPCKNGHVGPRDKTRRCLQCRRESDERRRARQRPTAFGSCSACGAKYRRLSLGGLCLLTCAPASPVKLTRLRLLQAESIRRTLLTLDERLWRSSMSWEREDLRAQQVALRSQLATLEACTGSATSD
jgi:hypothetical protein